MRRAFPGLTRRFRWAESGATAAEFAMVVAPLVAVGFGAIEIGRVLWARNALQETAIAGARCMGVLQSACTSGGAYSATSTTSYVEGVAQGWGIGLAASNISLNPSTSCAGVSGFSQVSITYTFTTVVPGVVTALAGGLPFTVSACFPNRPTS